MLLMDFFVIARLVYTCVWLSWSLCSLSGWWQLRTLVDVVMSILLVVGREGKDGWIQRLIFLKSLVLEGQNCSSYSQTFSTWPFRKTRCCMTKWYAARGWQFVMVCQWCSYLVNASEAVPAAASMPLQTLHTATLTSGINYQHGTSY